MDKNGKQVKLSFLQFRRFRMLTYKMAVMCVYVYVCSFFCLIEVKHKKRKFSMYGLTFNAWQKRNNYKMFAIK